MPRWVLGAFGLLVIALGLPMVAAAQGTIEASGSCPKPHVVPVRPGALCFLTESKALFFWDGGAWQRILVGAGGEHGITLGTLPFTRLPFNAPPGILLYCLDCVIANPCAAGGPGALAKRLGNAWVCN